MKSKEKINNIKRVFDKYKVKRTNFEDQFFMDIISSIEDEQVVQQKKSVPMTNIDTKSQTILSEKMELMVNIEGICNELKGKTKYNRYSFTIDIRQLPRSVFLAESKLLIRDREFQKSDIIVFYDDTLLRTGTRGFIITRDEIVTNTNGLFKVLRFQEMSEEPEYVVGHKRDAFRFHVDERNYDIKVYKNIMYSAVILDIFKILYRYGKIVKEENERFKRNKRK